MKIKLACMQAERGKVSTPGSAVLAMQLQTCNHPMQSMSCEFPPGGDGIVLGEPWPPKSASFACCSSYFRCLRILRGVSAGQASRKSWMLALFLSLRDGGSNSRKKNFCACEATCIALARAEGPVLYLCPLESQSPTVNSMWGLITHSACSTIRSYVAVVTHEATCTKATLKVLGKTLQFRFLHLGRISPLLTFNHLTIAWKSPGPSRRELGATPTKKSAMH
jgi:hypothetical protein